MADRKFFIHWPVLVLGIVVAFIFLVVLMVFEVKQTDYAIVERFGSPLRDSNHKVIIYPPGLHLKIPFVDRVWRHDNRLQCYDLKRGETEQVQTADNYQIIVTTFVIWKVGDPYLFLKAIDTTAEAERKLDEVVRNSRNAVLGRHTLGEMINVDPTKIKTTEIENEILAGVKKIALSEYGIDVVHIGIKHLGFPQQVTTKVFARMKAERERQAEKYRAEGRRDAARIRAAADLQVKQIVADAEAQATKIRGEGDQKAAEYYAVFRENPPLAIFLRKLEALRKTLSGKTTLVLDTNTPPYDLLLPGAVDLKPLPGTKADVVKPKSTAGGKPSPAALKASAGTKTGAAGVKASAGAKVDPGGQAREGK